MVMGFVEKEKDVMWSASMWSGSVWPQKFGWWSCWCGGYVVVIGVSTSDFERVNCMIHITKFIKKYLCQFQESQFFNNCFVASELPERTEASRRGGGYFSGSDKTRKEFDGDIIRLDLCGCRQKKEDEDGEGRNQNKDFEAYLDNFVGVHARFVSIGHKNFDFKMQEEEREKRVR